MHCCAARFEPSRPWFGCLTMSELGPISFAKAPWPQGVHAAMSLRQGGFSSAPFDRFNLGDHVGDNPAHVQANRQLWAQLTAPSPVFLRQVHGVDVVELSASNRNWGSLPYSADACWTYKPGVVCTMMVADCLPILLAAADGSSVAAVHAGWRGLAGSGKDGASPSLCHGVLESLCANWPAASTPLQRAQAVVWLGPCIGPKAFEVGAEVRDAFLAAAPSALEAAAIADCFLPLQRHPPGASSSPSKYLAHLSALARWRLHRLGFKRIYGNNGSTDWCTVSNPLRFFSHRRDVAVMGSTGRMAAGIWRC